MFDFKNATKQQLTTEFERLKKVTSDNGWGTKKEFFHLPEILLPQEEVIALSSGMIDSSTWLITLTNKRVIFLDKGMFYGLKQLTIDLDKIVSIGSQKGLLSGTITIATSTDEYSIENVLKATVLPFTNLVKEAIEHFKSQISHSTSVNTGNKETDLISQLERLAGLKEKGVLTEDEFLQQKSKLLSQ